MKTEYPLNREVDEVLEKLTPAFRCAYNPVIHQLDAAFGLAFSYLKTRVGLDCLKARHIAHTQAHVKRCTHHQGNTRKRESERNKTIILLPHPGRDAQRLGKLAAQPADYFL